MKHSTKHTVLSQPEPVRTAEPDTDEALVEPATDEAVVEPTVEEIAGFEGSWRAFEGEALLAAERDVTPYSANALVAFQNARKGVQAIMALRARLESDADAPRVDFVRVAKTVRVAEALVFGARRASNAVAAKIDIAARTARVYELRGVLMTNADAAVKSKALSDDDARKVETIRKGKGPIDAAQDCLDLAALFADNARSLQGRTFVTAEMLQRARTLASELLHLLMPSGVEPLRGAPDAVAIAADMRDRMALVLARYYAYVARVGGWIWGFDVAEHVPPLRSRSLPSDTGGNREPSPAPAPAPLPT
jgi:hypothetical protein